jgi:hypothetical protein
MKTIELNGIKYRIYEIKEENEDYVLYKISAPMPDDCTTPPNYIYGVSKKTDQKRAKQISKPKAGTF